MPATAIIKARDVELMQKIKNKDQSAELELFETYKPFIIKYYRKLCRQLPGIERTVSLEDFTSEVYLIPFRKTIEYCDMKKVRDENWKIVQIFGWFVKNLINKYVREDAQQPCFIPLSSLQAVSCDDLGPNYDTSVSFEDVSANYTKRINEKLTIIKFIERLHSRDRAILKDRLEAVETTGSPRPYVEMAKKFGVSKTLLQQRVKKLYKAYQQFCFG